METCTICARGADEHGRCERCVADANRRAVIFDELDHAVEAALESGLTPNQLHEAFELALSNRAGVLAGDCVVRDRRAQPGYEVWRIRPASSWDEDPPTNNRLRGLRQFAGRYTLEELAAELGEDVSTVALWEQGAQIPDEALEYLSWKFGASADFIAGRVG